jgi:hypothetical protein
MKKLLLIPIAGLMIASCSSYTADQEAAAKFVCDCMEKDENGIEDAGILYYVCFEEQAKQQFDKAVFSDDGYANALNEICPEQNLVSESTAE